MENEPVYWTMKNSQKINVMDMSVSHMQNTLKMLIRNNTVQAVKKDFTLNGDMAQEFNYNDTDESIEIGNNFLDCYPIHDSEFNRWK